MATNNWLPRAAAVAEVKTGAITAYDAASTYTMTRNGKSVSTLGTGGTPTTTAAALIALWNASTEVDLSEQTAANVAGSITLTMDEAGVPSGTCSLTVSGGTGTVTNFSTTTAATGPYHADNVNNWSLGSLPTTDDVQIDLGRGSILYGLDQLTGTGVSLYLYCSGRTQNTIGLPERNTAGYTEDRAKRLLKSFTTVRIDCQSPLIRLDFGSVQTTVEVRNTGTSGTQGLPAVLLAGTNASNVFEVIAGNVGLAYYADEACAGTALRLGDQASVIQGLNGGAITTITSRGELVIQAGFTTLNQSAGTSTISGTATPTINLTGGVCDYRAGNPTAFTAGNGGMFKLDGDLTPITAASVTVNKGGVVYDPQRRMTITSLVRGTDVETLSAA